MIDTVVLLIDVEDPRTQSIIDPKTFGHWSPNFNTVVRSGFQRSMLKSVYVDTRKKANRTYWPRLTVIKQHVFGGFICQMYVEFSVPKLLFGNNFDELQESDFPKVCYKLRACLKKMGVTLSYDQVWNAKVQTIHFGKNIVLIDGSIPTTMISCMKKLNVTAKKQVVEKEYKNGGEAFYIGTNNHQLCVYDKRKELERAKLTEKGNSESDNWCQIDILNRLKITEPFQVIRLESRSRGADTIQSTLEHAGVKMKKDDQIFANLFKSEIAKAVLEWELAELTGKTPSILLADKSIEDYVDDLARLNPKAKADKILKTVALSELRKTCGLTTARKILRADNTQWNKLIKDIDGLNHKPPPYDKLAEVRRQIADFKPVKLKDYCLKNVIIKGENHGKKK